MFWTGGQTNRWKYLEQYDHNHLILAHRQMEMNRTTTLFTVSEKKSEIYHSYLCLHEVKFCCTGVQHGMEILKIGEFAAEDITNMSL